MRVNRFGIGVRIAGHDIAPWVIEGGTIEYGRSTINEQPGAPTCHLTMFTREGYPNNPQSWFDYGLGRWDTVSGFVAAHDTTDEYIGEGIPLYIGAPVWVSATTGTGIDVRRFTGKVQSIEYSRYRLDVVCSGTLEEWASKGIMRPPELGIDAMQDDARAAYLAWESSAPTDLHIEPAAGINFPGLVMMAVPQDGYPLCLLPELQNLADDADALLYQDREGRVIYRHRSWEPPAEYAIPSGIVNANAIDMVLELGDMPSRVVVEYGAPDAVTGYRESAAYEGDESRYVYGFRTAFYTPPLDDYTSAYAHAVTVFNRDAPAWHMPDVELMMTLASDAQVLDVCALDQGYPVVIHDLPDGAPMGDYHANVLGWTEDLSSSDWVITMHLHPQYAIEQMPNPG
jgi:hypothetical protein